MTPDYNFPPENGRCKGQDVSLWFPIAEQGMSRERWAEYKEDMCRAIEICSTCESSDHCLEYSLRHEPYGIWGGKTESERAAIRSQKNIMLSRAGRIFLPGIGRRDANGFAFKGNPKLLDSVASFGPEAATEAR